VLAYRAAKLKKLEFTVCFLLLLHLYQPSLPQLSPWFLLSTLPDAGAFGGESAWKQGAAEHEGSHDGGEGLHLDGGSEFDGGWSLGIWLR